VDIAAEQLCEQFPEHLLVLGVGVGVKQRDGYGLWLGVCDLLDELARGGGVERLQRAVGCHALGCGEAQLMRNERCGRGAAEVVEVRAVLAGELDDVGEAGGGDERGARCASLEEGVGGHGHAVREARYLVRPDPSVVEHELDGLQDAERLLRGRGWHLGGVDGGARVDEDGVCEGAADVYTEEHAREPTAGL